MQGRGFHPWSGKIPLASDPHAPQLLSLCSRVREPQLLNLCAPATEACAPRAQAPQQEKPPQQEAPRPTRKSSPHSLPLEKAHGQQGRPRAAKEKKKRQQITNVVKDVEKREFLCTVGGKVNWCSYYGKRDGSP